MAAQHLTVTMIAPPPPAAHAGCLNPGLAGGNTYHQNRTSQARMVATWVRRMAEGHACLPQIELGELSRISDV